MDKKERKIVIILILGLIFIDQISKIFIIIKQNYAINVSFKNIFSSENITYILINAIIASVLIRYMLLKNQFITKITRIIISFAIAGILSNIIDRIWFAKVIAINLKSGITLNFAYIYFYITWIGLAMIFTKYTNQRIKNRKNNKKIK